MSIAWFSKLHRLNEAGKYEAVVKASSGFLAQRPKDYALHLQRARALLALGELDAADEHLKAAVSLSKGLAAWPHFYVAALCARRGQRRLAYSTLELAVRLDPRVGAEARTSPLFAAFWKSRRFLELTRVTARRATRRG